MEARMIARVMNALLIVLAVIVSGCSGDGAPARSAAPVARTAAPPPTAPARPHAEIVSITPETIRVRGGRAVGGTYSVEYRIQNSEKVEKAEIRVHARGLGDISRQPVAIQENGSVSLAIQPGSFDFGPQVRFRVTCPSGITDWYTLGQEPLPFEARMSTELKIGGVGPDWIGYNMNPDSGGAVKIVISGRAFTPECAAEAQVDGRPLELMNAFVRGTQIHGLIRRTDLDDRPVAPRYLEVKLSISGPDVGQVAIKRVRFSE